jgi:uncharacterized membrane protein YfcA
MNWGAEITDPTILWLVDHSWLVTAAAVFVGGWIGARLGSR